MVAQEWSVKPALKRCDALGGCGDGLLDFAEVADRDDFVSAKGDGFRVGILRVCGENFGVEEDSVSGGVLRPRQRNR